MSKFDIVKKAFANIMLNSTLTENMIEDHKINDVVFEHYNGDSESINESVIVENTLENIQECDYDSMIDAICESDGDITLDGILNIE
jgi:hypothetical protein